MTGTPTLTLNTDFTFTGTQSLNLGTGAVSLGTNAGTTRTITTTANVLTIGGIANGTTVNAMTKAGAGTLNISGVSSYTGNTTISAGTLQISAAGQLGSGNYAGNIANSGTLEYSSSANQSFTGVISGSGALTKDINASVLTLGASNTYTGVTTISDGTLITGAFGGSTETSSSLGTSLEPTAPSCWGAWSITLLTVGLLSMSVPRHQPTTLSMSPTAAARTQLTHRAWGSLR